MRPSEYLKAVMADAEKAAKAEKKLNAAIPVPKGWTTVHEICRLLNMAHRRNASSRAHDLHLRGLLDRQLHKGFAKTGQCHMQYVYRPRKPYKSIVQANEAYFRCMADKVPAGWVRIVDYAENIKLSDVALRSRIARARLKPRYFKTPRGIIGLHLNAHFRKADLDRLFCRKT